MEISLDLKSKSHTFEFQLGHMAAIEHIVSSSEPEFMYCPGGAITTSQGNWGARLSMVLFPLAFKTHLLTMNTLCFLLKENVHSVTIPCPAYGLDPEFSVWSKGTDLLCLCSSFNHFSHRGIFSFLCQPPPLSFSSFWCHGWCLEYLAHDYQQKTSPLPL